MYVTIEWIHTGLYYKFILLLYLLLADIYANLHLYRHSYEERSLSAACSIQYPYYVYSVYICILKFLINISKSVVYHLLDNTHDLALYLCLASSSS